MNDDVKYILDYLKDDIDTQCIFGNGADTLVQQAKNGYNRLNNVAENVQEMIESIEATLRYIHFIEADKPQALMVENLEKTLEKLKGIT